MITLPKIPILPFSSSSNPYISISPFSGFSSFLSFFLFLSLQSSSTTFPREEKERRKNKEKQTVKKTQLNFLPLNSSVKPEHNSIPGIPFSLISGLCDLGIPGINVVRNLIIVAKILALLIFYCMNGVASQFLMRQCMGFEQSDENLMYTIQCSGCLACCIKPESIASLDERRKGCISRGQTRRVPSISRDYWTTSVCDMDNSAMQSQGSLSSINASIDTPSGVSSSNPPSEYVNHGLLLWNQTRQRWVDNKNQSNKRHQVRDPKISWNATYESLLGSNKPFSQPVPLAEMVDFLVDIWEQEGMYD
ncbi:uncharacterized protein LOC104904564 isoform X3 [Beta vulgaris subsp. vulgaris]|uniref:uncharacterized protein LOC104904564 isoform X3 n=1 Tax=Beta vulgaris subsp. vulgaris TaxID=3555 RepID=UPI002036856F|nr:uncharacterized protein LOC104904564 isoform X3 [Beta vulgaris subsp. vulgaris]